VNNCAEIRWLIGATGLYALIAYLVTKMTRQAIDEKKLRVSQRVAGLGLYTLIPNLAE
jgi:Ca2+/H+ antiporter